MQWMIPNPCKGLFYGQITVWDYVVTVSLAVAYILSSVIIRRTLKAAKVTQYVRYPDPGVRGYLERQRLFEGHPGSGVVDEHLVDVRLG